MDFRESFEEIFKDPFDQEVEEVRQQLRDEPYGVEISDKSASYIDQMFQIGNGQFPSDEQLRQLCGDAIADEIQTQRQLLKQAKKHDDGCWLMRCKVNNLAVYKQKVEKYIADSRQTAACYRKLAAMTEQWLKNHRPVIPAERLTDLQREICDAHNEQWIQQSRVTTLYDDGEITSEKGGDLYGLRTVFTFEEPLLAKYELRLPLKRKRGEHTYAILQSCEVARAFRQRMLDASK